ncbi:MAG: hypothetical protein WDN06_04650 [Asticcacaulis sp.]
MTGIDSHVDPLLSHVRLNGDLALVGMAFSSDNLRLKTDRLQASSTLQGDLSTSGCDVQRQGVAQQLCGSKVSASSI